MDFTGRNILITGAASGIGLATARQLAAAGAERLILTDVDGEALARVGADAAWGCTLDLIPGDVRDEAHLGRDRAVPGRARPCRDQRRGQRQRRDRRPRFRRVAAGAVGQPRRRVPEPARGDARHS